ncbi:hypothetical protein GCM10027443_40800 [Pontibacter brevis]
MITTQVQYHAVASRIEQLKDAMPGSEASKELKVLTKMLVDFESKAQQPVWNNLTALKPRSFRI